MAAQNWADYFCSEFGGTPHQESENMIRKLEGTRDVKGTYMAKTKLQQMCRSQGIDGQLVLYARDEHVLGITGTDYKWVTCRRTNRALRKTPSFGAARAYKRLSQHLILRKKSCPAGISTGSILKDELRVAKWVCHDMANASSSQAVCWRVFSMKAQAVSFANLSAQELPSVRKGSWQRSCLPQWAFTFVKGWPRWVATELNKTHGSRLSRLVMHPFEKPLRCKKLTMLWLQSHNKSWYSRRSATKLRWLQRSQPVGLFGQGLVGDKLLSSHTLKQLCCSRSHWSPRVMKTRAINKNWTFRHKSLKIIHGKNRPRDNFLPPIGD